MLSRRPNPMIGKLSELLVAGNRAAVPEISISPRSPLDFKIHQSPRNNCSKRFSYDLGGVGLGIVAELGKSIAGGRQEIIGKSTVSGSGPARPGSDPIPCCGGAKTDHTQERFGESLEDYTYVTCRRGPKGCYTKVYKDGCELHEHEKLGQISFGVVEESPEISSDVLCSSDFLSSCDLCDKKLHGQDTYMYRGEKAFCSEECRSSYIVMDERKEKCRSEVSASPYAAGEIFSTGVLVI